MAPNTPGTNGGARLVIDTGGTFIDYVLLTEETGEIAVDKQPAYSSDVVEQLLLGYDRLLGDKPVDLSKIVHGSTFVLNAILEESGAKVGLITTRGYRDALEIRRGSHPEIYNFLWDPPRPAVARRLRREVTERMDVRGNVLVPLDKEGLLEEAGFLVRAGVEAVSICFLHSYANPAHEQEAKQALLDAFPDLVVACSSEVAPEPREFERTSTCVLSASVMPMAEKYFSNLGRGLEERGFGGDFAVLQSNGGVMPADAGMASPIRMLQSGPSGGVIGARALSKAYGDDNVICADVGGTSFDVALIEGGEVLERQTDEVDGRPVIAPTVDIKSIGAGGGSIAWIDDRGTLRVGPKSAGAHPGPVCYGRGGVEPTVTDCSLLLGRINRDNFLGRRVRLDVDASEQATQRLADALEMDMLEAAAGVVQVVETNMVYALRQMTIERGHDPRDFTLLAYGGGGGLFADILAQHLELPRAIVPSAAAVFSAWGALFADYREDASTSHVLLLEPGNASVLEEMVAETRQRAVEKLLAHGIAAAEMHCQVRVDARFVGQEYPLSVSIDPEVTADGIPALQHAFIERHRAEYGHSDAERAIEIVAVRVTAVGRVPRPDVRHRAPAPAEDDPVVSSRPVWFSGSMSFCDATIWSRPTIAPGTIVAGPAVIEEWNTTTLVGPGRQAQVDEFGSIVIERAA